MSPRYFLYASEHDMLEHVELYKSLGNADFVWVDQVVDVFYVRDFDGQKLDLPDQVAVIKDAIAEVLQGRG